MKTSLRIILFIGLCAGSLTAFDHGPFDRLLQQSVKGDRVDYGALRRFFRNREKGLYLDRENNHLALSRLFKWFGEDFGRTLPERLHFISRYVDPQTAAFLRKESRRLRVTYLDYSWDLNDFQ